MSKGKTQILLQRQPSLGEYDEQHTDALEAPYDVVKPVRRLIVCENIVGLSTQELMNF